MNWQCWQLVMFTCANVALPVYADTCVPLRGDAGPCPADPTGDELLYWHAVTVGLLALTLLRIRKYWVEEWARPRTGDIEIRLGGW